MPRKENYTVRLDAALKRAIAKEAAKAERTEADFLRRLLRATLMRNKHEPVDADR